MPVDPTVATAAFPLIQSPPAITLVIAVVAPTHTVSVPEKLASGNGLIVTVSTATDVPQLFVTV